MKTSYRFKAMSGDAQAFGCARSRPMRALASGLLLSLSLSLSACAPTTPNFNRHFSEPVRTLNAQQQLRPEAAMANRLRVPEGLDGRSARETLERYHKSFEQSPRQANPFVFGFGGQGGDGTR